MILCDRCRGFIDENNEYYVSEKSYNYQSVTNQRLDKIICNRCYRLLPSYLQSNYIKKEKER